ncbi:unnamed protein product [Enterobius vermicularis]|uniref:Uncharacterized protein n=1 Tax=Enterobius vermicularis TaxID=51028 RepID=A0A0N4UTH7_ENTVE|nr:unnamed protein product [Enterobius vermicularis]
MTATGSVPVTFAQPMAQYCTTPNGVQQFTQMSQPLTPFDASGQSVAVLAPVTQAIPQAVAAPPSTGQQRYDEVQMAWQNTPNSEVRHSSTPRRSPVKSLVPLTNRFSQMSVQSHQHYVPVVPSSSCFQNIVDRKDGHSTGSPDAGTLIP